MVWIKVDHDTIINSEKIVEINWKYSVSQGKVTVCFYPILCGETTEKSKRLLFTKDLTQRATDYMDRETKKGSGVGHVSGILSAQKTEKEFIAESVVNDAGIILKEIFSQVALAKSKNQDSIIDLNEEVKVF